MLGSRLGIWTPPGTQEGSVLVSPTDAWSPGPVMGAELSALMCAFNSDQDSVRWAFVSPIGRVTDCSGLPRMGGGGVLGCRTFGANTKNDVYVLQSRKQTQRG